MDTKTVLIKRLNQGRPNKNEGRNQAPAKPDMRADIAGIGFRMTAPPIKDALKAKRNSGDWSEHLSSETLKRRYRSSVQQSKSEQAKDLRSLLSLQASSQPGSLQGIVRDEKNNPVPSALVKAVHAEKTDKKIEVATDIEGRFWIHGMEPGEWRLTSYEGKRISTMSTVRVTAGQTADCDLRLAQSSASEDWAF